jgi:hypothetical protein
MHVCCGIQYFGVWQCFTQAVYSAIRTYMVHQQDRLVVSSGFAIWGGVLADSGGKSALLD